MLDGDQVGDDVWGIVLAGGAGSRFGLRKQFQRINRHSLVELSVRATAAVCKGVVVVLPEGYPWAGSPVHAVATGGATRIWSARNGLAEVPESAEIVLIHDAAHPLASAALFSTLLDAIRTDGVDAAFPVLPVVDTVMRVTEGMVVETIDREGLVLVQTPQAFKVASLRAAFGRDEEASDESVLMQRMGARIRTIPGELGNLHVTVEQDVDSIARLLEASRDWAWGAPDSDE